MCPARASLGSPTTTNTKDLPLITAKKKKKEPAPYQSGKNPVLENWALDSNAEAEPPNEEPSTQEETPTLSVSGTSGLMHYKSEAPPTKANWNKADGHKAETAKTLQDSSTNQSLTKDGLQDR